jgi:multidrug efflux pump subunit AcrA (membrane-fusion protein)
VSSPPSSAPPSSRRMPKPPGRNGGTVRAYVVTLAPEVAGRIVELPVVDNQFVHKGDVLMVIDPTNYRIAVSNAEAAVQRAEVDAQNAKSEAKRRRRAEGTGGGVERKSWRLIRRTRLPPKPNFSKPWPTRSRRG